MGRRGRHATRVRRPLLHRAASAAATPWPLVDPAGAPATATWNTYIWVDDVDASVATAREAGGTVVSEPFDVMDAGRMAVVADPEGAAFCLWQAAAQGRAVVNEHGALNFNGLATRDVERARPSTARCSGGRCCAPAGPMWALPGYGDHLEESTPGLGDQMEQMGAPARLHRRRRGPAADRSPDDRATPAHWERHVRGRRRRGAAARAKELGGEVVSGPMDAPWSRLVVIKDPQGATFVAGQFVPENSALEA